MSLYVWEAANLFCGDDDPSASKHLQLDEIKLPVLEEKMQDHHPGGSLVGIKVGVGHEPLMASFKLGGWDPGTMKQFGLGRRGRLPFTARAAIRNKRNNKIIVGKAIMEGRLAKIEGEAFKRGEFQKHDHVIDEIWHYELYFDGEEMYFWDFQTAAFRIGGVSQVSDVNAALGLG